MLALMANRVGYWFSDRAGLLGYNTNQSLNLGVVFEAWVRYYASLLLGYRCVMQSVSANHPSAEQRTAKF
jgi:hypothetical protein